MGGWDIGEASGCPLMQDTRVCVQVVREGVCRVTNQALFVQRAIQTRRTGTGGSRRMLLVELYAECDGEIGCRHGVADKCPALCGVGRTE